MIAWYSRERSSFNASVNDSRVNFFPVPGFSVADMVPPTLAFLFAIVTPVNSVVQLHWEFLSCSLSREVRPILSTPDALKISGSIPGNEAKKQCQNDSANDCHDDRVDH